MFPTIKEVQIANRVDLCKWYGFLRPGVNKQEKDVKELITTKFLETGGFTHYTKNKTVMFPTLDEVKIANRIKLCSWYRHLRSGVNPEEWGIQKLIYKRFLEEGGFNPEISKQVGW